MKYIVGDRPCHYCGRPGSRKFPGTRRHMVCGAMRRICFRNGKPKPECLEMFKRDVVYF